MIWVCYAATGPGGLAVIDLVYKPNQSIQTLPVSHLHTGNVWSKLGHAMV